MAFEELMNQRLFYNTDRQNLNENVFQNENENLHENFYDVDHDFFPMVKDLELLERREEVEQWQVSNRVYFLNRID